MTFIASVVAKKGVAIIADSLVTSEMPILHFRKFIEYIENQPKTEAGEKIVNPDEIIGLFNSEPVYTKDYEEKLFQLNDYTAITTTGMAYINNKSIADIVESFKASQLDINDMAIPFSDKLDQFSSYLNAEIAEHLTKHNKMGYCAFIISYYEKHTHNTHLHKAIINEIEASSIVEGENNYVALIKISDWEKVVCDGQNKISENVLYGHSKTLFSLIPTIIDDVISRLNIKAEDVPANFVEDLMADSFYKNLLFSDIEIFNLSNLSVQQAVDLASLLMRLEVDFQKYTKNIPTVGGLIKLAVIDELGFRFISGDKIEPPKHIHI